MIKKFLDFLTLVCMIILFVLVSILDSEGIDVYTPTFVALFFMMALVWARGRVE